MYLAPSLDGSLAAYSPRYGEHFHNRNGAQSQAEHVFLRGSQTDLHAAPAVLEIGFGFGLNFLTTLLDAHRRGVALVYRAFEIDPQPRHLLMEFAQDHAAARHPAWEMLMTLWPETGATMGVPAVALQVAACELRVDFGDATTAPLPEDFASAIYLDGFSPKSNPELWSMDFIARLAGALRPEGALVTYSAAGAVRRALGAAGLAVERLPGVAGKREFLRARALARPPSRIPAP